MTEQSEYRKKKMVGILSSAIPPETALNEIVHLSVSVGAYADRDLLGAVLYGRSEDVDRISGKFTLWRMPGA